MPMVGAIVTKQESNMTAIILRRRKLGRTSAREIARLANMKVVRNWVPRDWRGCGGVMDRLIVFRWGCTSSLTDVLQPGLAATTTVNTAASISWCSDKKQGRLDMQEAGVPVPKTWGTWTAMAADTYGEGETSPIKIVIRPVRHAQGRNLWVYDSNTAEAAAKCRELGEFYISELINKVAEFRVFVCQNRVVWVAQKTPGNPEDVAWNVARGGRFDNVRWGDWNTKVIDAALKASVVSGTDFCGVDVMVDAEGNAFVLEVNSAPSQTSPYRQASVAKAFDYIVQNGKRHFDKVEWNPSRTWKSYIHPALWRRDG